MAIFQGEELVPVTTPDGRTLTLPRSLVPPSLMPQQIGQTTAPAGVADETSYNVGERVPESVTGGAIPTADVQTPALPPPAAPREYPLATIDQDKLAQQQATQQKKDAKTAKAQAAYQASPQGQRDTVNQQTQNAIKEEKTATVNAQDVDAAAADMLGHAAEDHNIALDRIIDQKAQVAQANFEAEQQRAAKIDQTRQKIANTKIDRESDHPIINAIGMALVNLGAARNRDFSAPGLEILWKAIDRKVAGQMADLDLMEKNYGMEKDALAALKDQGARKLEVYNTLLAGETDKAKRHLDEIVAKTSSAKIRANAQVLAAQLDQKATAAAQSAMQWGQEYDQRERAEKNQNSRFYAGLAETKRSNIANEQLKREDMYLDLQKHLAQVKATSDTEMYKAQLKQAEEVSKRGIRDMNGDLFLLPDGKAKVEQAKQLDAQAAQLEKTDPQRAAQMHDQASAMRGEAQSNSAILAHSDTEATKLGEVLSGGQSTVQLIDQIKLLSDQAGRGLISRTDAQVKLRSMFQQLAPNLKEAWQLGAWDKGSANLVSTIIGYDPSSEWNAGALASVLSRKMYESPDSFKGALDSVADQLERSAKNKLAGLGAKFGKDERVLAREGGVDFNTPEAKAAESISKGKTPVEAEADATPGVLGKARDYVYSAGGRFGDPQYKINQEDARNSASLNYPALSKDQAPGFESLLQAYKKGDPKAGDALVAQVANASTSRPELAGALARTLRDNAPDLYVKARAAMPKDSDVDKQMSYEENNRLAVSALDTPMLVQQIQMSRDADGKIQDSQGFAELARRAKTDKVAGKALLDLVTRKAGR